MPLSVPQTPPSGRNASIVIAPSDAPLSVRQSADIVCTGSTDQATINSAIASLLGRGGKVKLLQGTFICSDVVVVDADWVTLEGEGKSHWNAYKGKYPIHDTPGSPGGSKLVQTTSGKGLLTIGTTSANMNGDTRHKGIAFRDLYLLGQNYNATAIYDDAYSDICEIRNCTIQGFLNGIDVAWDTPQILYNNVQDNAGFGIRTRFVFGLVHGNICFDLGGNGIWLESQGTVASDNTVGDLSAGDGIAITRQDCRVIGNHIEGVPAGNGIVAAEHTNPLAPGTINGSFCSIQGNTIILTGKRTPNTTANTTKNGISIGSGSDVTNSLITGCAVNGNVIQNSAASTTGYAIALNGTSANAASNNAIVGNTVTGAGWNSASTASNIKRGVGTGNVIASNAGDLGA